MRQSRLPFKRFCVWPDIVSFCICYEHNGKAEKNTPLVSPISYILDVSSVLPGSFSHSSLPGLCRMSAALPCASLFLLPHQSFPRTLPSAAWTWLPLLGWCVSSTKVTLHFGTCFNQRVHHRQQKLHPTIRDLWVEQHARTFSSPSHVFNSSAVPSRPWETFSLAPNSCMCVIWKTTLLSSLPLTQVPTVVHTILPSPGFYTYSIHSTSF